MITSDDLTLERQAQWEDAIRAREQHEDDLENEAMRLRIEQHAEDMQRYLDYRAEGYSEYQSRLWAGLCDPCE